MLENYSINFEIKKGEIVGFLGANGAGKTTILKMLCGLIYPSNGKLMVAGHLPYKRRPNFLKNITLIKSSILVDKAPYQKVSKVKKKL